MHILTKLYQLIQSIPLRNTISMNKNIAILTFCLFLSHSLSCLVSSALLAVDIDAMSPVHNLQAQPKVRRLIS